MSAPSSGAWLPAANDPLAGEQRRIVLAGWLIVVAVAVAIGGWAAAAPIAGVVVVAGTVAVESERQTVQHLEGGIVRAIRVQAGSVVAAGQPLIELDPVQADAAVAALRQQLDADLARRARLEAERGGATRLQWPAELASRARDPVVARLIAPERKLFDARRAALVEQVALLRTENRQILAEIDSLRAQVGASDAAAAAMAEQVRLNERLRDERFISQARVLDLRGQHAERVARRDEARAAESQARQRMTQNELKVVALQQAYVREATDELRDTERRIADTRERLRPGQDLLRRQTLVAPIAGEVVDLKVHTVGGVVAPREPLMDIVPARQPLLVKGRLRVEDITHVTVGAEVDLQLVAYRRRVTPVVAGRLAYVSADSLSEQTPAGSLSYYEVRITVDRDALAAAGDLAISPGMPVEAHVKTAPRTLLAHLMQPVALSLGRAMRD